MDDISPGRATINLFILQIRLRKSIFINTLLFWFSTPEEEIHGTSVGQIKVF